MSIRSRTNLLLRYVVSAFGLAAAIGWSLPGEAHVQQIVIDQTATVSFRPIIVGTSTPGDPTSYTIYTGRVFGELGPAMQAELVHNAGPVAFDSAYAQDEGRSDLAVGVSLGDDPDLRYTPEGKAVANFSVAYTPRVQQGEEWVDGRRSPV